MDKVILTPLQTMGCCVHCRSCSGVSGCVKKKVQLQQRLLLRGHSQEERRKLQCTEEAGSKGQGSEGWCSPREADRAQSECARLASSTSHTQTPRERSQRNIYVCIYLPLGKSWGAAWDRTLLSPAHIRTQCKNTTWAPRILNHTACVCPSAVPFEAWARYRI